MSLDTGSTARSYERLRGRSVVAVSDLEPADVAGLLQLAAGLQHGEVHVHHPLRDLIVLTAFFEPSTRTRLSFESAALRLGAGKISIPDGNVLDASTPLKEDAVILHPLARTSELDPSLDGTSHNGYFDQAAGAVFVREALLLAVTGRVPLRAA